MLDDEQTTGIKNIYLVRIAPYEDQLQMELTLKQALYTHCVDKQEIFFDRDIPFSWDFRSCFYFGSYLCPDGIRRSSLIIFQRTNWSKLAREFSDQRIAVVRNEALLACQQKEIQSIMHCDYPYNCVTAKSLEDEIVCERFKKLLRSVFEDELPISFDIIKRCVKEREVRAAMARDDFCESRQRIVGVGGGSYHKDHFAWTRERTDEAYERFKGAQEQGQDDQIKGYKKCVLYHVRNTKSSCHLPGTTVGVKDNVILCAYVFLPRCEGTNYEATMQYFQKICGEIFGCDELLPFTVYYGESQGCYSLTKDELLECRSYLPTMRGMSGS